MADATAYTMPSDQQNTVVLQSETGEVSASSSSHSTTAGSAEQTKEETSTRSHHNTLSPETNSKWKPTVYEPDDSSAEPHDNTSYNPHFGASSPRVPWRKGGIWHLRSGNQRGRRKSSGGTGRAQSYPAQNQSDSDTDSSVSDREFYLEDFEDTESEFGMGGLHEFVFLPDPDRDSREHDLPEEPLYPQGLVVKTECYVCFEESELRRRLCCDFPVCDQCLESYLMVQVLQANVNIECLNINCNSYIHRNEISARLPPKYKMRFYKFLIDANIDPTVKTCPRCSSGLQVDKVTLKKRKVVKNGLHVTCKRCGLDWCFTCHAPLHKGLTCKEYRKGDILLKEWAREFHYGQLNAQQCPKCKIFIQRSLGCDHMICTRCSTNFCYRCGENYRGIKLLGNHFSRYSPFGCRYNFLPDAPHLRRFIRGAVLGGKLLGGLVLSGFVVAAGACLLGVSVIALPVYGTYKLHKRRGARRLPRISRKYTAENMALRNLESKTAADLSVPPFPVLNLDSSDSMADDSSDEMRDRIVVGLELPDSQQVEVLVHQTVSSGSDQEEGGASGGPKEIVTDSTVIVTDVQEVVNEDGYTTLVTNVYAKSKDTTHTPVSTTTSSDESDKEKCSDDECSGCQALKSGRCSLSAKLNSTSGKEHVSTSTRESHRQNGSDKKSADEGDSCCDDRDKLAMSVARMMTEGDPRDQQWTSSKPTKTCDRKEKETGLTQEKKGEQKEGDTEKGDKKPLESESGTDKKEEKLSESGDKKAEKDSCPYKTSDQKDGDELSKESTNGCFGNIFSKKIAVIQIGSRRNTETQADIQKPANTFNKSSTWEKSREKSSQHKHKASMDIQDLSHFKEKLPLQAADICVMPAAHDKGVLLQDFFVLSRPGDFTSESIRVEDDGLSLASASSVGDVESGKEAEKGGEGSSCCCLSASDSFRGSNLSCDIVTYL